MPKNSPWRDLEGDVVDGVQRVVACGERNGCSARSLKRRVVLVGELEALREALDRRPRRRRRRSAPRARLPAAERRRARRTNASNGSAQPKVARIRVAIVAARANRPRLPRGRPLHRRRHLADRDRRRARCSERDRGGHAGHRRTAIARRTSACARRATPGCVPERVRMVVGARARGRAGRRLLLLHARLQRARGRGAAGRLPDGAPGRDRVLRLPRRGVRHRAGAPHAGPVAASTRWSACGCTRPPRSCPCSTGTRRRLRDGRDPRRRALHACATPTACCGRAATCWTPTSASTAPARSRPPSGSPTRSCGAAGQPRRRAAGGRRRWSCSTSAAPSAARACRTCCAR